MRDLYHNIDPVRGIRPQTITSSALNTGSIDLSGFESCTFVLEFGDIDEMGGSPVGSAGIAVKIEHADDDGTGSAGSYSNVVQADVIGGDTVSSGVVETLDSDTEPKHYGYVGGKKWVKMTLTPTGLTNGGEVSVVVVKGHPKHAPTDD